MFILDGMNVTRDTMGLQSAGGSKSAIESTITRNEDEIAAEKAKEDEASKKVIVDEKTGKNITVGTASAGSKRDEGKINSLEVENAALATELGGIVKDMREMEKKESVKASTKREDAQIQATEGKTGP